MSVSQCAQYQEPGTSSLKCLLLLFITPVFFFLRHTKTSALKKSQCHGSLRNRAITNITCVFPPISSQNVLYVVDSLAEPWTFY